MEEKVPTYAPRDAFLSLALFVRSLIRLLLFVRIFDNNNNNFYLTFVRCCVKANIKKKGKNATETKHKCKRPFYGSTRHQ